MTQEEYMSIVKAIQQNDWDEVSTIHCGRYTISQFQGTAFDSEYKCYMVQWTEWKAKGPIIQNEKVPCAMVAKITSCNEVNALQLLSQVNAPVPKMFARVKGKDASVMLFMQMMPGKELYSVLNHDSWVSAAEELAEIHLRFWDDGTKRKESGPELNGSNTLQKRIQQAHTNVCNIKRWKQYLDEASGRLEHAPKTLVHGDMFPTNVLVHRQFISFIDWADASIFCYMMDLGRLTAIIDRKTLNPMCPCPEKVIRAYYEKVKERLSLSYDEYLHDIHIAQFIELAAYYSPYGNYGVDRNYNATLANYLDEIVFSDQ